ncbi:MAG: 3-isopropylmalate dehydratase small subunit [Emcibacter sp.]|nr:3-isopropylmalate dehydratase small subunit [Emcibacter sp.]
METFKTVSGIAIPFPLANVDTDLIVPSRYLKTIKTTGIGEGALYTLRFKEDGSLIKESIFNQPQYKGCSIMLTGPNFGCGSSREHAVWALKEVGFRVLIGTSYADIFASNCYKNGILTITAAEDIVTCLMKEAERGRNFAVNLEEQTIVIENGATFSFDITAARKGYLLQGLDEISLTLKSVDQIKSYQVARGKQLPWQSFG